MTQTFSDFASHLNGDPVRRLTAHEVRFRQFAASADLQSLIASELERCKANTRHPARIRSRFALTVGRGDWFVVELVVLQPPEVLNPITTELTDDIYYFLSCAEVELFDLRNFQNLTYCVEARAVPEATYRVATGDTIAVEAERRVLAMRSSMPIRALVLSDLRRKLFGWDFDRTTGKPVQQFNTYPVMTVFELMARFLGAYGDETCTPTLAKLLEHRSDTVKWHAVNALTHVNAPEGLRALQALANSTSPAIARAARQTLQQIEGGLDGNQASL
jgi:hypothetical protein